MKRIISLVLVVVMAFGFGMTNAKAENLADEGGNDQHRAKHYTYDGAQVDEAFQKNQVKDLYNAQKIVVPSNMNKVKITETEDGIKFSGKRANLQAGRIDINKQFRFGDNYVGRFSIEATRAVAKPITIKFYIDADINPFCSIAIGREGRIDPVREIEKQEQSRVVMEEVITGHHSLSFSFETDCEEAEVTFKTFEFVQSALPVVSFDIDENEGTVDEMNTSEDHSAECHGNMNINVPAGYTNEYSNNLVSASYPMEYIRGRGNSTWMVDKKPYKVKLAKKNGLLGMPANKHWVLLANVYDNSEIRNKMTYELGRRMNMPFTPKSVPVDVVMNGEYYGLYYLSEQVRLGENRVDIPDLTDTKTALSDDEITGGYLLSLDSGKDEDVEYFETSRGNQFYMESPQLADWQNTETSFDAVKDYISSYVGKCEEAMFSPDYRTKEGQKFSDLIDVDSMITYYLFQEISQNGDGYANGSTYLYKDRNAKLCWGPIWDFDYVAWAGSDYMLPSEYSFVSSTSYWNGRMLNNAACFERLEEIYAQMKAELLDMTSQNGYIDELCASLSVPMHYEIEKNGFYEHTDGQEPYVYSFSKERDRLKTWINGKLTYLDDNMENWAPEWYTISFTVDGNVVSEQKVLRGERVEVPEDPVKEGYIFNGWYNKVEGEEEEFNPDRTFDEDMTIYAKFTSNKDVIPVKDIIVRTDDVYSTVSDNTYLINYKVSPVNATIGKCECTSSNPDVASIEDSYEGLFVKSNSVGTATITLTSHNGIKKSFVFHVMPDDYDVELEDVDFEEGPIKLKVDESRLINYKYNPVNAPWTDEISYIIGDDSIIDMSETGIITGVRPGTTYVLAEFKGRNTLIEVVVEGEPKPVEKKDALTLYGEFLKANKNVKYYSIFMQSKKSPLLIVANKIYKGKYAKNVSVYTVHNNKVIKVGDLKAKKSYVKLKSDKFVTKLSKKSIAYYKAKTACFTGNKYVKKKKKYYSYKWNCTKFIKKKKISKKKGKKYLKAKGAKSIVFTAK